MNLFLWGWAVCEWVVLGWGGARSLPLGDGTWLGLGEIGSQFFDGFSVVGLMGRREYKLVVFDLDFTVWDAGGVWCDCLQPPFSKREGRVYDAADSRVFVYEDITWALEGLLDSGYDLAIASRTSQPSWARELLDLLGLRHYFSYEEIYPTSKLRHFAELKSSSGYDYSQMLFFDDEARNIEEVGELGVRCVYVQNGFKREQLEAEIDLMR